MNVITLQDLDSYIGWTLVSVGASQGAIVVRFRSSVGELADVSIAALGLPVRLGESEVVMGDAGIPSCPKSPTGIHAWRHPILSYGPNVVTTDQSQPKRCILCGATATDEVVSVSVPITPPVPVDTPQVEPPAPEPEG
jgi:hypothetical protein